MENNTWEYKVLYPNSIPKPILKPTDEEKKILQNVKSKDEKRKDMQSSLSRLLYGSDDKSMDGSTKRRSSKRRSTKRRSTKRRSSKRRSSKRRSSKRRS